MLRDKDKIENILKRFYQQKYITIIEIYLCVEDIHLFVDIPLMNQVYKFGVFGIYKENSIITFKRFSYLKYKYENRQF